MNQELIKSSQPDKDTSNKSEATQVTNFDQSFEEFSSFFSSSIFNMCNKACVNQLKL